jgi:multidrug efflux pump subunit AcrB
VENDITRPIEDAVNTVSGIKTIRANSWEGRAGVYIDFELSTNMDKAMQDLRDKVAQVRPRFPKEAKDPFIVTRRRRQRAARSRTIVPDRHRP